MKLLLFILFFSLISYSFAQTKQEDQFIEKIDDHLRNLDLIVKKIGSYQQHKGKSHKFINYIKNTLSNHKEEDSSMNEFYFKALEFLEDLRNHK